MTVEGKPVVHIDGSRGEGGGQILRTALALAATTRTPVRVSHIRAGRAPPGLKAQHLAGVRAVRALCGQPTGEARIGDSAAEFAGGPVLADAGTARAFEVDMGGAGSVALLLQTVLIPLLEDEERDGRPRARSLAVRGGTHGTFAPTTDYLAKVLLPIVAKRYDVSLSVARLGLFPRGGGEVTVRVGAAGRATQRLPIRMTQRTPLVKLEIVARVGGIRLGKAGMLELLVAAATRALRARAGFRGVPLDVDQLHDARSASGGLALLVLAYFEQGTNTDAPVLAGSSLSGKKVDESTPEAMARDAVAMLERELDAGAVVDEHLADQLVPFLALCGGGALRTSAVTQHALSNMDSVHAFLPRSRFTVVDEAEIHCAIAAEDE